MSSFLGNTAAPLPLLLALAVASSALAQPAADPRGELEAFAAALDRALASVSRPAFGAVLPASVASRGYHLKGYGAVFVVPPRALPAERRRAQQAEAVRALELAARRLEQALRDVDDPELRNTMRASLEALREPLAGLRQGREGERKGPQDEWAAALADVELELELDTQVRALQRDAEVARGELERSLAEIEQHLRAALPAEAAPPQALAAPEPPAAPAPPPWSTWFQDDAPDARSPERVIREVGEAVSEVLESHGPRLRLLRSEDAVVVAVDFVSRPGRLMLLGHDAGAHTRAQRTLVVRVRKRELEARREGGLERAELRKRIEQLEY